MRSIRLAITRLNLEPADCAGAVAVGLVVWLCWAPVSFGAPPMKRAKAPLWTETTKQVFFDDAREALVGERPDYQRIVVSGAGSTQIRDAAPSDAQKAGDGARWSALIDADTIEAEIKRLSTAMSSAVTTPGEFKGEGYQHARENFSMLAVLFGVAGEFDGDVRWKDVAMGLRDQFSRAGRNAKVGTDQTYREAVERKQELEDLVRGSRPSTPSAEPITDWSQVADRPPLMQRLNVAQQDRLNAWLANEREFERSPDDVRHEAQIMAMLGDVIARKGYEFWDDETFVGYAIELRDAAVEITKAVDDEDYERARKGLDRATKACADCHDGYRG